MAQNRPHTQSASSRLGAFSVTFVLLFVVMIGFMAAVDALPESSRIGSIQKTELSHTSSVQSTISSAVAESPVRVAAKSIGMDVSVKNPTSTNVEVLDQALLSGAVRYPTSGLLGVNGTVLIFGHSSYLPIVHNSAYKAFNSIQNLKKGEIVSVYSKGLEYRYSVTGVRVADATEDVVELRTTGKHLVLVTCDSFKSKSSRFVVTADFVGTYSLASR